MSSRHHKSDCTSRIRSNETAQQVAEPADRSDDESNEESNDENNDKIDEENDMEIDKDSDEDVEEENKDQDGASSNSIKDGQEDDDKSLEFRIRPKDYPSPSPPGEKQQQLADAVAAHKRLLAFANWSAMRYDRYHRGLHTSQLQIFELQSPRNPTGLTIAARANAERFAVEEISYWSTCMGGERQRWINTRKEIKAVRLK
ncbi:MAG: hypothetical protein LQ347_005806, partial [Umbilicaria vellea]